MAFSDIFKKLNADEEKVDDTAFSVPGPSPEGKKEKKSAKEIFSRLFTLKNVCIVLGAIIMISLLTEDRTSTGREENGNKEIHEIAHCLYNETVAVGNMEFSILNVEFSSSVPGDSSSSAAGDGNLFCVITLSAKNIGKEAGYLVKASGLLDSGNDSLFEYTLLYDTGFRYASVYQGKNSSLLQNYSDEIIPLQTVKGVVVFEVPAEVAETTLDLGLNISSSSDNNIWLLR